MDLNWIAMFVLCFLALCEGKKSSKKKGKKLPSDVDKFIYCEACEATIEELHKALKKPSESLEVTVIEALDTICHQDNFKVYDFIPPKMEKACKHLMSQHEEDLEKALIENYKGKMKKKLKVFKKYICQEVTDACKNVDKNKRQKGVPPKAKVVMDGEEKELNMEYGSKQEL